MKRWKLLSIFLLILLFIAVVISVLWILTPYRASQDAVSLLKSTSEYDFTQETNLEFIPKNPKDKGIIVYPGGRVESASYSYICARVAEQGFPCIVAIMPLNLAVTKIGAADEIISKFSGIKTWTIVGHSLGGSMAARYINDNSNSKVTNLVLLGAYSDIDLSNFNIEVAVITASLDKILNLDTFVKYIPNLPTSSTNFIDIKGGNHSQFGDYGLQEGDAFSKISKEQQQQTIVEEIILLQI